MAHASFDMQQQQPWQNPLQLGLLNPQLGQAFGQFIGGQPNGLGLAAYGSPYGPYGQFGQSNLGYWGGQPAWGAPQRQLSPQDVGDVVRQLVPLLPHIIAQAQQPLAAIGYGPQARMLTQHDVNEVVRQILPIVPQIVGALQGQGQFGPGAYFGGFGPQGTLGQAAFGQGFGTPNPFNPWQMAQQPLYGQQFAAPAAYGTGQAWGQAQRQLTHHDVAEVARQLASLIPQLYANPIAGQMRMI